MRISVRDDAGTEIGSTDLMERTYQAGSSRRPWQPTLPPGWSTPATWSPSARSSPRPPAATAGSRDSAVFSDIEANYTVTTTGGDGTLGSPGSVTTVVHNGAAGQGTVPDGTDTLRNIERLVFADTAPPATPVLDFVTAGDGQATVNFIPTEAPSSSTRCGCVDAAGDQVGDLRTAPADANSLVVTGLTNGSAYRFQISAGNAEGTSPYSALSDPVTPRVPITTPDAPTIGAPSAADASATVRWTAPANTGGSAITSYNVRAYTGTTVVKSVGATGTATSVTVTGLTNGTAYTFDVRAVNAAGTSTASARSTSVTPVAVATAPAHPASGPPAPVMAQPRLGGRLRSTRVGRPSPATRSRSWTRPVRRSVRSAPQRPTPAAWSSPG